MPSGLTGGTRRCGQGCAPSGGSGGKPLPSPSTDGVAHFLARGLPSLRSLLPTPRLLPLRPLLPSFLRDPPAPHPGDRPLVGGKALDGIHPGRSGDVPPDEHRWGPRRRPLLTGLCRQNPPLPWAQAQAGPWGKGQVGRPLPLPLLLCLGGFYFPVSSSPGRGLSASCVALSSPEGSLG